MLKEIVLANRFTQWRACSQSWVNGSCYYSKLLSIMIIYYHLYHE